MIVAFRMGILSVILLVAVGVLAQGDLVERIERIFREGRYDLARDLLDDHERNGQPMTEELIWWRARLERDPDRFDRLALDVSNRHPDAARRIEATLARAREHFARGRYRMAVELLDPLAQAPDTGGDGRVLLWLAMAEQASGQAGAALRNLRAIEESDPSHAMAQALLADLALRGGRLEAADEHARLALSAGDDVAAIALSVLARSAVARGDERAAREAQQRLRERAPSSAELQWVVGDGEARDPVESPPVAEVVDGERRTFALQLGAFRDRSLALRMVQSQRELLDEVRIEVDRSQEAPLYRVVGGAYLTRAQAEAAQAELAARGMQVLVLAPTRGGS
jgi:tetratricopeptide (TPR) repeat protein